MVPEHLKTEIKLCFKSTNYYFFSRRTIREIKHRNVSAVGGRPCAKSCMSETAEIFHGYCLHNWNKT